MHWDTIKQDNYSTVGGDGGCRVGEVRAGTTSPMPDHKGLSYSNCQTCTHSNSKFIFRNLAVLRVKCSHSCLRWMMIANLVYSTNNET